MHTGCGMRCSYIKEQCLLAKESNHSLTISSEAGVKTGKYGNIYSVLYKHKISQDKVGVKIKP